MLLIGSNVFVVTDTAVFKRKLKTFLFKAAYLQ